MTIGVAIIGGGIFAREYHLPGVLQTPAFELKAVYSRSIKSANSLKADFAIDYYSDDSGSGKTYHDLLLREDVQAVIIALPILSQPEYIEAALAAGKHVLSEKPIADNLARAHKLVTYYKSSNVKKGATWGVAENFRFLEAIDHAREEVLKLGKLHTFSLHSLGLTKAEGNKFYDTPWRKVPGYQGGFLLDGGIHQVAALRLLLGPEALPTSLSAYSTLLQEHLPPVDTLSAIWQTKSGISGTFSMSFGAAYNFKDITVIGENGSVSVAGGNVVVRDVEGEFTERAFDWGSYGVKNEIQAWAASLEAGKPDPRQSPEQALADLEILEKMLKSGEEGGKLQELTLQL